MRRVAVQFVRGALRVTLAGALFTALALGAQVPRKPSIRNIPHPAHPKLVVMIVVDQMRGDYVDKLRGQWTGGLKRLVEEGAWFHEASYPYTATETCVGHATISTGAFPASHGIIANAWWDRDQQKMVTCTSDFTAINAAYAGGTDYLGVSYSTVDYVGQAFGPRSREIQDILVRLDKDLGELLAHLDRKVGRGNYIVALTADHGVMPVPEDMARTGVDTGVLSIPGLQEHMEKALEPFNYPKPAIARMAEGNVYLFPRNLWPV